MKNKNKIIATSTKDKIIDFSNFGIWGEDKPPFIDTTFKSNIYKNIIKFFSKIK